MMKRFFAFLTLAALTLLVLTSCGGAGALERKGYNVKTVNVKIDGAAKTKILYVADYHICIPDGEVAESDLETVKQRSGGLFMNSKGEKSADRWEKFAKDLDAYGADLIVFGGDMADFSSEANLDCLKKGLDLLETPYMYIRADHDSEPYYLNGTTKETCRERHNALCPNDAVMSVEFDGFTVVGINYSTSQMTKEGLDEFKRIAATGKPILLMTHVPLESRVDFSLSTKSLENWGNRELFWGAGSYYKPNATTTEFLDIVFAADSPVKEVFAGHLHFDWDGMISETVHQHVFDAAYYDNIGEITVG